MEGIFRTDCKGNITDSNQAFMDIVGFTKEKLLGSNLADILVESEENLLVEILTSMTKNGASNRIAYFLNNKNLEYAYALSSIKVSETEYIHSTKNIGVFIRNIDTTKYNEEKYKLLYDNNPLMLFSILLDGNVLEVNPMAIKQLGYSEEELIGQSVLNIFHPEEHRRVKATIDNFLKTEEQTLPWEFRKITKSGKIRWVSETAKIVKDEKYGKVILVACEDITARKEIEIEQKNILERLSIACKAGQIGIWEYDVINDYLIWDEQMFRLFDVERISFNNSIISWKNTVYADDLKPTLLKLQQSINDGKDFDAEFRIIWKDKQIRNIRAFAKVSTNEIGKTSKLIGVNWDITESKATEKKLRENEERLHLAMQGAGDGLWDWDIVNNSVYYSPNWETMFGFEVGSAPQNLDTVSKLVHPEDLNKMMFEVNKYLNHEVDFYSYEFRMIHPNGNLMWTLHRAVALFDDTGKALRMIGTTTDTTQRKQIEESLRKAQYELELRVNERTAELAKTNEILKFDIERRIKAEQELIVAKEKAEEGERLKTSFLQNMSHEIRTPMNGIMGFAQLLNNPELSEEKRQNYASIILNSSNQLLSVVTDILTISSLDTNQEKANVERVNVNNVIVDLLTIFKLQTSQKNISIFSKQGLNDFDAEVYLDGSKLTQILTNLLSNAVKFTHEGTIEFGYKLDEKNLVFFVKDTGIGIKQEYHTTIFQRFRQADMSTSRTYGGTGLGLSISQGFAELLGTKIEVDSKIGKGSTFHFAIPYNPVNQFNFNEKSTIANSNIHTILIVEDDEINYLLIEEIINNWKYIIIHAKDGNEAIELCKLNPQIDLVLMDIRLPIMNGLEASKEIKKFRPELVIIALSAFALDIERLKYDDSVFNHYLTKPFKKQELKEILDIYLTIIP